MVSSVFTEYHSGSFGEQSVWKKKTSSKIHKLKSNSLLNVCTTQRFLLLTYGSPIVVMLHHSWMKLTMQKFLNVVIPVNNVVPFNTLLSCLVSLLVPTTKSLSFQSPMHNGLISQVTTQ